MENNSTTPMIYKKIIDIMRDCPAIDKNGLNGKQGYKYRAIDDIKNDMHAIIASHGVFWTPEVLEVNREEKKTTNGGCLLYSVLRIKYTFYAEDGSHVSAVVIGEGMDSGDKASNKAMSAGEKYALSQVFNIATKETSIDSEKDSPEVLYGKATPTTPTAQPAPANNPAPQMHTIPNYPGDEEFLKAFKLPDGFQTVLTLADAETMEDSAGNMYGTKPLSQLWQMLDIIQARITKGNVKPEEKESYQDKVDAILLLMDYYKKHPERIKQAGN